jgi:hypothetical protein
MAFNTANLGQPITKKLVTGRLFAQLTQPVVDTFFRDYGNVVDHKLDQKVTRKEHMKSSGGLRRVDVSLASSMAPMYEFTLDELTPDLEALRQVGTQNADVVQAGAAIVNEQLCNANSQQGRVFFTAQSFISAWTVKVGATVCVDGTGTGVGDFSVDAGTGAITILNASVNIPNESTVTISYTSGAVTQHSFNTYNALIATGNIKFVEYDQFSGIPRTITTFVGQLYVTSWGDNKGDYNQPVLTVIPLNNPTVLTRAD